MGKSSQKGGAWAEARGLGGASWESGEGTFKKAMLGVQGVGPRAAPGASRPELWSQVPCMSSGLYPSEPTFRTEGPFHLGSLAQQETALRVP